ncbi:MAG: amidohydrolase family protein, partial [Chloroflexi bacterium]|nr:amidohydrolase family protein [Chloroflexota bacterium]
TDRIVTAGLIDVHCHVADGVHGIHPDLAGITQGVTTVVDAGSTGAANFKEFLKHPEDRPRTRVFCFLNLCSRGLCITPELQTWGDIDSDAIKSTVDANSDFIRGIKLRLVGDVVAADGVKVFAVAKRIADTCGLPIMVHIGDSRKQVPETLARECLALMGPGDILSHVFTPRWGGLMSDDDTVFPELRNAMDRGVMLDVAHGGGNFSYAAARTCMARGIMPTLIGSDVGTTTLDNIVYGLTVTMSKILALGLNMNQLIKSVTINPARALGIEDRVGSLKTGKDADISILSYLPDTWSLEDAEHQVMGARLLTPFISVRSGQVIQAQPAGRLSRKG